MYFHNPFEYDSEIHLLSLCPAVHPKSLKVEKRKGKNQPLQLEIFLPQQADRRCKNELKMQLVEHCCNRLKKLKLELFKR